MTAKKCRPIRPLAKVIQLAAVTLCLILAASSLVLAETAPQDKKIGGVTPEEALRLGEKMYREGILPSGKPMQAIVKDDVPVEGTMFTCVSCHLRSGFGTGEGTVRTPPIDGTRLYAAVAKTKGIPLIGRNPQPGSEDVYRPAYTDKSLAHVIETGIDPAGRQINTVMPVYVLNDQDREIMVYYLKNLSTGPVPGVTETTLHFATVITDEVPSDDREAMVGALKSFLKNWRLPRGMERTVKALAHVREGTSKNLRKMTLTVWELKGPAETWPGQLEEYYRKEPAFALLGGISTKEWRPIHQFCEQHRIPAIFPITDFPVLSDTDWHTMYLSKGLYQEGETAARYLNSRDDLAKEQHLVQIFRNDAAGLALSKAFRDTWVELGHEPPAAVTLQPGEPLPGSFWKDLKEKHKRPIVLMWLKGQDFPDLALLAKEHAEPAMVFASSSLLGPSLFSLPESARGFVYLTYPYSLPQEMSGIRAEAEPSLMDTKIPLSQRDAALKMSALFRAISDPLAQMRSMVYRDYFIEMLEGNPDLVPMPRIYPRLSFGQGQRYASKGCYIVQLTPGPKPELEKRSEWIIH